MTKPESPQSNNDGVIQEPVVVRNYNKTAMWIIFFVVLIDLLGFGIVFPILPEYTRTMHIDGYQAGLIIGIYSLMQFLFSPILGKLSDKIGRRPVLVLSMLGTALSFIMMAYARSFEVFLLARALDGIAGSSIATAQAYIADMSPKDQRTRNMGMWIGAAFGLGFALGPALGAGFQFIGDSFFPNFGPGFAFLIAGLMGLVNLSFALFKLPESRTFKVDEHKIGQRTSSLWVIANTLNQPVMGGLIIAYGVTIFGFAFMESTITWLSIDFYKLDKVGIYILFAYFGFLICYGQGKLVRKLSTSWGDYKLAIVGTVLLSIGLYLMPLYNALWYLGISSGLMCIGESLCQPSLLSSISKNADDDVQGETMGVAQSFASLARFLGPITAAWLYQNTTPTLPYFVAGTIILFGIYFIWRAFSTQAKLQASF